MIETSILGRTFIHSFWLQTYKGQEEVECEVIEQGKNIKYKSLSDKRVGQCKPGEFWGQFKRWTDRPMSTAIREETK